MADIIPKEKLAAYQRWQLDAFDEPGSGRNFAPAQPAAEDVIEDTGEPVSDIPLPTAEDIERIHEEARAAGYEAGLNEGRAAAAEEAEASAREQLAALQALVEHARESLATLDQSVAESVLELSLTVARQVLRSQIRQAPETLLPTIREALSLLPLHHAHVNVHLHPSDAERLRPLLSDQAAQGEMRLVEDKDITPGGCHLRAGTSEIDATLETRWQRVLDAIGAPPTPWDNQA